MEGRSLRSELARASFITTCLALVLMAGALLVYEFSTYRDALVKDMKAQADMIARSSAAALTFDDPKVATDNLALLKLRPAIVAAAIFRKNGEAFARYRAEGLAEPALQRDRSLEGRTTRFLGATLDVAYPVEEDGETLGWVYLRAHHDATQRVLTYAAILFVVMGLSLVVAFILFGRLQRRVTRPLTGMTRVAEQVMERRDWSLRASEGGTRDISILARAFNGMLAEVQQRTGELERSNRNLEQETLERRSAEDKLRQQDKRKDEFLATLAHELRNPLAPMMNAVVLIKAPNANAAMRDRAATIVDRQLRHMVRLIDDLLDVSRIMTGKLLLHRELVDLEAIVRGAVEIAEPSMEQKHQTFSLNVNGPIHVVGDAARLTQVFANLLNNASKYTPAAGSIRVDARRGEDSVSVDVQDSGIGIDPSMQLRVFELFEQVDKSMERGSAGLGIGLTLARQLVQMHGGTIAVASEGLGRGSCFTVRLPVAAAAAADIPPDAVGAPSDARLKILVADDNVDYAQSLCEILASMGHDVRVVHDGRAAVASVLEQTPDVALLDIGMPVLNGYDAARTIRQYSEASSLRLIAITGWGQAADKANAANAGFDSHLVKPVAIEDLVAVLSTVPHRNS